MAEDLLEHEPHWYRDAVIYEVHVKTFFDSNDDGIGDFRGLKAKLDYLADLGVTAIWLLPFYPSPLKDDGYDIADDRNVNPDYGTMRDFKDFLREAHRRGIRVITELVLNHTSDQHAWFRKARLAKPGSRDRDFYVWSETPERYTDARIIFQDFEHSNWAWDPVARAYYWHRFYHHQPDLNYDNRRVKEAIFRSIDFWFRMGVDGLRLDAVPYLFEREGTNCENLPETHGILRELRAHVEEKFRDKMLLAEANQWPEDAAAYFGAGDECHMAFHFPLMPRMFMAVQMEDSFPVTDILEQTPALPEGCQWALFLRNHDELTLEMVTDEERDYMYRVYAVDPRARINLGIRRRLAPLLGNNRRKIELLNIMLFTLPGTPVIYYGDEIGMGDNYYLGDRDGVRTPMQWSSDRNAGFSRCNPQRLYLPVIIDPEHHYEALNVESQARNPSSLLWWMRRAIAVRRRYRALGRGDLRFLASENPKILAYLREHDDETILVLINLSRFSQSFEIELGEFAGWTPEDVFSLNSFPAVKDSPYAFMLGPHGYHIFQLLRPEESADGTDEGEVPTLTVKGGWRSLFAGKSREELEKKVLPACLAKARWFGGKARALRSIRLLDELPLQEAGLRVRLCTLEVSYADGAPEFYFLPVAVVDRDAARDLADRHPQSLLARMISGEGLEEYLADALFVRGFQEALLGCISRKAVIGGQRCKVTGQRSRAYHTVTEGCGELTPAVLKAEQSNTSIVFGDCLILKIYRRLDEGVNPDLEVSRFLTEHSSFPHSSPFAGALAFKGAGGNHFWLGQLQGFVPGAADSWVYTLDAVGAYCERVQARKGELLAGAGEKDGRDSELPPPGGEAPSLFDFAPGGNFLAGVPPLFLELIGTFYPEMAAILGRRTGELHIALTSVAGFADFTPEPFSLLYQRSVYQSMRSLTRRTMQLLRRRLRSLPADVAAEADLVLAAEGEIIARFDLLRQKKIDAMKIRIHGDYHLGQVLFTGKDFVIIDFEGEPARSLGERRLRRSALRDVAGMIRSFHYAALGGLYRHPSVRPDDVGSLTPWAERWYLLVSRIFLNSYLDAVSGCPFLPADSGDIETLLRAFLLEKAVYETSYELNNRPDWLHIPLKGIRHLLGSRGKKRSESRS